MERRKKEGGRDACGRTGREGLIPPPKHVESESSVSIPLQFFHRSFLLFFGFSVFPPLLPLASSLVVVPSSCSVAPIIPFPFFSTFSMYIFHVFLFSVKWKSAFERLFLFVQATFYSRDKAMYGKNIGEHFHLKGFVLAVKFM